MKNLKMLYIALIALVTGAFGACTNEFEPGPQVSGPQVSFADTNITSVEFTGDASENTQKLILNRVDTAEDLMIDVIVEVEKGAEKYFTVPEFATFAAGESSTELEFVVDQSKFENDKTYTVKFYLDESASTPYGYNEWTVSFALNPWELMKDSKDNNAKGKFRGNDLFTALFNIDASVEIDVNIYEHKSIKGYYKVEDPWALSIALGFGYSSVAEAEADGIVNTHAHFLIDASNPNEVVFAQQTAGVDIGYGDLVIESGYPRYFDAAAGAGTLSEGIITFPTKGCIFAMPGYSSSAYYANNSGMFRIVLPGVEIADYSLAVAYDGMDVAADNKTTTAKFKFTYGADVNGINYMLVAGNQEEQASALLSTLIAGEDENILSVENFEAGKGEANVKVGLESGIYTIVAAPADKAGALRTKEALVQSFYFAGMGNTEEHPCEIGVITTKFSEAYPSYASQYPDYMALAFCIYGTDIKDVKFVYLPTDELNSILAQGATLEDVIIANNFNDGNEYKVDLAMVNSENGWTSNAVYLKSETEYTIAVLGTNTYGESAVATTTHTTDAEPKYTGELVIGDYSMYCKYEDEEGVMESSCVFNVASNGGSHTDFIVTNFGVQSSYPWNAKYDSAAGTLTLDGTINGQGNKCYFGGWYLYYSQANNTIFGLYSVNGPESTGNDPVVLTVDPATKQISGLATTMVEVLVVDGSTGNPLYDALFVGGLTQIAPYAEAQTQSATLNPVYVPLRNANAVRNTLYKKPNIEIGAVEKIKNSVSLEASAAWKTSSKCVKSVKPSVVENYTPAKVRGFAIKANPAVIAR